VPVFTEQTGAENPFGGVTITHNSAGIAGMWAILKPFGMVMVDAPYASPAGLTPTPNPDP
jgi:hypothetical protein